jgi:FkbM family methyltransferase
MDRKLEQYLPTGPGFFVEAGANDGYLQSNTYYLERFKGWSGVLVEPIPELFERCVVERPRSMVFNCALVRQGYPDPTVRMHYGGLMSVVSGARGSTEADEEHVRVGNQLGWDRNYFVDVPARTLSSVLDEADAKTIDLLSLDVEGYEEEALLGLRLESHAPRLVLIEALETERRASIRNALGTSYELVTDLSPNDLLFRLRG